MYQTFYMYCSFITIILQGVGVCKFWKGDNWDLGNFSKYLIKAKLEFEFRSSDSRPTGFSVTPYCNFKWHFPFDFKIFYFFNMMTTLSDLSFGPFHGNCVNKAVPLMSWVMVELDCFHTFKYKEIYQWWKSCLYQLLVISGDCALFITNQLMALSSNTPSINAYKFPLIRIPHQKNSPLSFWQEVAIKVD